MPKIKAKERIIKVAREMQLFNYRGTPIRFLDRHFAGQKKMEQNIRSDESRNLQPTVLPGKASN